MSLQTRKPVEFLCCEQSHESGDSEDIKLMNEAVSDITDSFTLLRTIIVKLSVMSLTASFISEYTQTLLKIIVKLQKIYLLISLITIQAISYQKITKKTAVQMKMFPLALFLGGSIFISQSTKILRMLVSVQEKVNIALYHQRVLVPVKKDHQVKKM